MNSLILLPNELIQSTRARITGSRLKELYTRHDLKPGQQIRVGILRSKLGQAVVESVADSALELTLELNCAPPPRQALEIIVGISRPQTLKKVIHTAVVVGCSRLHLVRCSRSEKSYLRSKVLSTDVLQQEVLKGLEQAIDTNPPDIVVHERFRPFVEDELTSIEEQLLKLTTAGHDQRSIRKFIADTSAECLKPYSLTHSSAATILAVGPEAGWDDFECDLFAQRKFEPLGLGVRTMRVETALAYALGLIAGRTQ